MAVKHDLYYFPYNADYQDIEDMLQAFLREKKWRIFSKMYLVHFANWRSIFSSSSLDSQTSDEDDFKVWW